MSSKHQQADEDLADAALGALRATAGLNGWLVPLPMDAGRGGYRPDVAIAMSIGPTSLIFYGECKTLVDRQSVLARIKINLDGLNAPGLLIASYLSQTLIESCRAIGLQCIDTAGNAYLDVPGLHVLVKGQKPSTAPIAGPRERLSGSASALRMIFVLLANPELTRAPYREIAKAAGIALGTVGWVFRDLARRGLVSGPDTTYGRRMLEPDRLLDVWAAVFPLRLRPKLHGRRLRTPDPNWWRDINPIELDAWWGGKSRLIV